MKKIYWTTTCDAKFTELDLDDFGSTLYIYSTKKDAKDYVKRAFVDNPKMKAAKLVKITLEVEE